MILGYCDVCECWDYVERLPHDDDQHCESEDGRASE